MPLDDTTPRAFVDLPNRGAAAHLLDGFNDSQFPTPTGYHVAVLQYITPEKKGSLFIPEKVRQEDEYQGCVGIVLSLGNEAYADSEKFPAGAWVQPGDWVAWPRMKASVTRFALVRPDGRRAVVSFMADDAFVAVGVDPLLLSM